MNSRVLLAATALAMAVPAAAGDVAKMSGDELLKHMMSTYAALSTYEDTGVVRIHFIQENNDRVEERPFSTAFVRPGQFRFAFQDEHAGARYVVARSGDTLQEYWSRAPFEKTRAKLWDALAAVAGPSGGSSATVPGMLLPAEIANRKFTEMKETARLDDEPCGSSTCAKVEGKFAGSNRVLWIDTQTLLLRRVDETHLFRTLRTEQTTTYEPVANRPIDPARLAFGDPRGGHEAPRAEGR